MSSPADLLKKKFANKKNEDSEKEKEKTNPLIDWLKQKEKEKNEGGSLGTQPGTQPTQAHTLVDGVGVGVDDVVQERAGEPTTCTIAHGFPACPHCQSSWITEHPDAVGGGVCLRCWSCRGHIAPQVIAERIRINALASYDVRRLLPW